MAKRGRRKKKKEGNFYVIAVSSGRGPMDDISIGPSVKYLRDQGFVEVEMVYSNYGTPAKTSAFFMGYETDTPEEMMEIAVETRQNIDNKRVNVHVYDLVNRKIFYKEPADTSAIWSAYDRWRYSLFAKKTQIYGQKFNIDNMKEWGVLA